MRQRTRRTLRSALPALALAGLLLVLAGCSEEEKKPVVSANLCLTMPNGMVLGPYDTKKQCETARENMPEGKCHACEKGKPK